MWQKYITKQEGNFRETKNQIHDKSIIDKNPYFTNIFSYREKRSGTPAFYCLNIKFLLTFNPK